MFFDIVNRLVKSVLLLVSSDCLDWIFISSLNCLLGKNIDGYKSDESYTFLY